MIELHTLKELQKSTTSRHFAALVFKTVHQQIRLRKTAEMSQHLLHMMDFSILNVQYIKLLQHQVLFRQMTSIILNSHCQVQFCLDVTALQKIPDTSLFLQCHYTERLKSNFAKCCFSQAVEFLRTFTCQKKFELLPGPHPTTDKKHNILLHFYILVELFPTCV